MRDRSAAGRAAYRLLEKPRRLLITILLGNLIINIFATSTATARRVGTVIGAARSREGTATYPLSFWLIALMVALSRRPVRATALRSRPCAARIARGSLPSSWPRAVRSAVP